MTGKNPFASEPDPGPTFPALGPASVQEHFPGAAVGTRYSCASPQTQLQGGQGLRVLRPTSPPVL